MWACVLAEACWLGLLAGLVFGDSKPRLPAIAVTAFLGLLALLWPARAMEPGRLAPDRGLLLAAGVLFAGQLPAAPVWPLGYWPLVVSVGLLTCGWIHRRHSPPRRKGAADLDAAVVVTLLVVPAVVLVARGLLAVRSSVPLSPGSLEFLWLLPFLAAMWFGLDAFWRRPGETERGTGRWTGRLWDRRCALALLLALVIQGVRLS